MKKETQNSEKIGIYMRTIRLINHHSLIETADKLYISFSNLSRMELNHINIANEYFDLFKREYNIENVEEFDYSIYDELDKLINKAIFVDNTLNIEFDIYNYNDLTLPYKILAKYIQKMLTEQMDEELNSLKEIIENLYPAFEEQFQTVCLVMLGYNYIYKKNYLLAQKYLLEAMNSKPYNEEFKLLMYQYLIVSHNCIGDYYKAIELYNEANQIIKKYPNYIRSVKLNIAIASAYSNLGNYNKSLDINFKVVKQLENKENFLKDVALFNIGCAYENLHKYDIAKEYFKRTLNSYSDNMTYFELAWCSYQLNENTEALKYIAKAKESEVFTEYYTLFNEWLEAMINRKYSQKSLNILKKIERKYKTNIHKSNLIFLYKQFIDYYMHHSESENALTYSLKLNDIYNLKD